MGEIKAILFGSIGSVAETSEYQRQAYNEALRKEGVNWQWDPDTYGRLLGQSGGRERLKLLSDATGENLDDHKIERIHSLKTQAACKAIRADGIDLRPGVSELVRIAKKRKLKLGFVTSTYRPNVDAILEAARGQLSVDDLDIIVVRDDVEKGKPAPDVWKKALERLGLEPEDVIAIEDTANAVQSAKKAGIRVIATPGAYTQDQDVSDADLVVPSLGENGSLHADVQRMLN